MWCMVPSGDIAGVCGRRGLSSEGEPGADEGVSGRLRRKECVDALLDGREIGLRVGVRKRNGRPAMSSLCLCMRSRTCDSTWQGNGVNDNIDALTDAHRVGVHAEGLGENLLQLVLLLVVEQLGDTLDEVGRYMAAGFLIALVGVDRLVFAGDGCKLGAGVGIPARRTEGLSGSRVGYVAAVGAGRCHE